MIRPPLFKRWSTLFTGKISIHWTKSSPISPLSFSGIVEHERAGKSPAARKVARLSSRAAIVTLSRNLLALVSWENEGLLVHPITQLLFLIRVRIYWIVT